jgi:hypothetical protein
MDDLTNLIDVDVEALMNSAKKSGWTHTAEAYEDERVEGSFAGPGKRRFAR